MAGILDNVLSQLPAAVPATPGAKDGKAAAAPAKSKPKPAEKPAEEEQPAEKKPGEQETPAEEGAKEEPAGEGGKKTGNSYSPAFKERFGERA